MTDQRRVSIAKRALKLLNAGYAVTSQYACVLLDTLENRNGCFSTFEMMQFNDDDLRQSREDRHGKRRRRVWLA